MKVIADYDYIYNVIDYDYIACRNDDYLRSCNRLPIIPTLVTAAVTTQVKNQLQIKALQLCLCNYMILHILHIQSYIINNTVFLKHSHADLGILFINSFMKQGLWHYCCILNRCNEFCMNPLRIGHMWREH